MSDPSDVKRVLARLANGESTDDYRAVVDAAADAVTHLSDAAAFVAADGRQRLADAIDAAEAADDHPAARRGRRAQAALDDLRTALEAAESDAVESDAVESDAVERSPAGTEQ